MGDIRTFFNNTSSENITTPIKKDSILIAEPNTPEIPTIPKIHLRKSCETPPEELIVALFLLLGTHASSLLCVESLLRNKIQELFNAGTLICKDNLDGYIANVINQGRKSIAYLKLCEKLNDLRQNTKRIIIAGKKQMDLIPELNIMHESVKNKAKTIKSDLYIETLDGKFIGVSIKQNGKCQDTNFSVLTFFKDKDAKQTFIKAKTQMMEPLGITAHTYKKYDHRGAVNKLLLNRNNPLWEFIRNKINENPIEIGKQILEHIYGVALPYPIIKFSGKELRIYPNEKIDPTLVRFEEHEPFYKNTKNTKDRNTAKMFYLLEYKEDRYRVEVRFKGNHGKGTSPQFLAYNLK